MAYSPTSYSYSVPSLSNVLGSDWASGIGSLMDRGVSGAGSLMDRRFAGERDLQRERLDNALALARLEQGSAAALQQKALDTERLLAEMGYGSAADLQRGQLGFGREQLRETGRQFDATLGEQRRAPLQALNIQRLLDAETAMEGRRTPSIETPLTPTLGLPRYNLNRGTTRFVYVPPRR